MESFQPREEIASFQHFAPRKFPRKTTDRGDKHRKDIEVFSMLMTKKIIETLDAKRSWYDVHEEAAGEAEEVQVERGREGKSS
jgi:hypothetical protein